MTGHKIIFGLSAICAALICAFFAQSAVAVGKTGVTCTTTGTQVGTTKFSDEDCTAPSATGSHYHVAFTGTTEGELRSVKPFFLKGVIGGLEATFEAKNVSAKVSIANGQTLGGEMFLEGQVTTIVFEEVTVSAHCEVVGIQPGTGTRTPTKIETQPIKWSTQGSGTITLEPNTPSKILEFEMKDLTPNSCPPAFKRSFPLFGKILTGSSEGAIIPIVHATTTGQAAPKLRLVNASEGPIMGLAGNFTLKAGEVGSSPTTWKPIAET